MSTLLTKLSLILALGAMLSAPVFALPEDREQPIRVTADQALRNEKEGFTVYSGNVEMVQGTLNITANKITIYRIIEEADKIVAKGHPAHLQQQPELGKGLVNAHAEIIEYYKDEARVHLKQNALIEQDGSKVTGDTIDYYVNEQLVKAGSNRTKENSRVVVVIPAQAIQKSEDSSGATDSE
jgi:lipopolysaccharide export system protein LptA